MASNVGISRYSLPVAPQNTYMRRRFYNLTHDLRFSDRSQSISSTLDERLSARTNLARILTEIRTARGLTQKELATLAGMSQPEVSRIECRNSQRMPEIFVLMRLVEACGFTLALMPKESQSERDERIGSHTTPGSTT